MKLTFDEIVELIHREMYVRNGVMFGEKAAAKAIIQAEQAAKEFGTCDCYKPLLSFAGVTSTTCLRCNKPPRN